MGKLKEKILELEEQGIITWNKETATYYFTDRDKVFDFGEYFASKPVDKEEPE